METFTYYAISITHDGKMWAREETRKLADVQKEMFHFNVKTIQELVSKWDKTGQSFKKYRYFLISPNMNVFGDRI